MLGADDREARQRIEAEVRDAFASMAAELRDVARSAGAPSDVRHASTDDDGSAERLFEAAAAAIRAHEPIDASLTIYAAPDGRALAWAGRPTELGDRLQSRDAWLLVSEGELGLRLAYVTPILDGEAWVGSAAAERPLSMLVAGGARSAGARACGTRGTYCFPTRLGPVSVELPTEPATKDADGFDVRAPSGDLLFRAIVRPEDRALTRDRWQKAIRSSVLIAIAVTLLLLIGPLLDWRNRTHQAAPFLGATLASAALVIAARSVLTLCAFADWTDARLFSSATYASYLLPGTADTALLANRLLMSPFDFLLTTLTVAALVVLAAVAVERWRLGIGPHRRAIDSPRRILDYLATQLVAGWALAALLIGLEVLLRDTIANSTLDLVHFSLQPWESSRTALGLGILIMEAAVAVLGVVVLRAAMVKWRLLRADWPLRLLTTACWLVPLVVWQAGFRERGTQQLPLLVAAGVVVAAAHMANRLRSRYHHGSQAFRLTLLALGLVVPAVAFYPTLFHEAGRAKLQLVETRYADQVRNQWQTLQAQLEQSLREIDAANLTDLNPSDGTGGAVLSPDIASDRSSDLAFRLWRQTALADPITSSIELYGPDGNLVSRFAFNLPEDLTTTPRSEEEECMWMRYGEVAAFFAEERPVLHAGRNLCQNGRRHGSIVVHAMPDFANLPFISSRMPYRQILRPSDTLASPGSAGRDAEASIYRPSERDVEFAFYGWSFTPLYPSNQPAWQLGDEVRERLEHDPSHSPFWRQLRKGDDEYDVYLLSDRGGVYALGFPIVTPLGHLVNLAEVTVLAAVVYLCLIAGNWLFGTLSRRVVRAPALLREIRASFYRKLFLAFVAAVIFPVAALALVTRDYVVQEMRATVEQEAVRTASAARRVVEDLVTQLSRITTASGRNPIGIDDNLMVWVSRLIDQDVNVFEGSRLAATSQRDLFASGSLPTRAPADVFWALQIRNEAAAVTHDRVGSVEDYLVAATPLTAPQRADTMLTVPLTSGQQEIERRIATLNRHMLLGALLFILAGAGLGYSMAERISDPVNRLTRATRRISRGDLDARIVARSSDELRRLVDDFNSMAGELQRQQKALQQTHRLEAWAEMARQVAHDIKNPLTPIQLTAEHLRRVHADRGEPLGAVLQECVATILTQVRLLRQIAAEFSSFASSPIARPAIVEVPELLEEILQPYRIGLKDRIRFAVDVPTGVPSVYVDRTLMTRALTNVIENALHAMPGAGTLALAVDVTDGQVRIRVTDTGAGMDTESLARAFEPYFSTKASGTGLGLPIAKRNIELNGGTIAVTSERERGTSVVIGLPAGTPA
jgi:signal transduction histidine kinase